MAVRPTVIAAILGGGGVAAVGSVKSVVIADATPIDPVSSIGASGSGWVALVVLKGITSLVGTVNAAALTLTVTDPGFDSSGNATTVTRTVTGVSILRRQYPNGASPMLTTDGTDLTLYISLDGWIYSGSTVTVASIGSSFYTGCVASSAPLRVNQSTMAYTKPLFAWINKQNEATGSTYAVEAVAFHRHAQSGRQVAALKFTATDGTNNSATITTASPSLSALITQGNIPEVYKATLDFSGLTQGAACTINAQVYPFIGDSSSVLDLAPDGIAWPTSLPQTKLNVLCDRTGAYGGAYAYVSVGASGGAVSSVPATAKASPFPTIATALAAVQTWNNANKGHNDLGGSIVRLMDNGSGGAQNHSIAASGVNAPGSTWCTIEKDPATGAVVSITFTTQSTFAAFTCWRNLTHTLGALTYNWLGPNTARSMFAVENCIIDNTTNKTVTGWYGSTYYRNVTFQGGNACELNGLAAATQGCILLAGAVGTATSTPVSGSANIQPNVMIGCQLPAFVKRISSKTTAPSHDGEDGLIVYNNRLGSAVLSNSAGVVTLSRGVANVQNVFETDAVGENFSSNWFADGDLTNIANYVEYHNTAVGERASRMYNDNASTKIVPNGLRKHGASRYCIWDNYNVKGDAFNTGAGSVGSWAYMYSVGNAGNVSLFGEVGRGSATAPHNDNADGPYLGMAWLPSSEYNLQRQGLNQAQVMALFTTYTAQPQAVPARGGNYQPVVGATLLKNRVPAGASVLGFDIAGTARKSNGTGAAGAYEI